MGETSATTRTEQPKSGSRGAIRISLPAHIANDSKRLKQSIVSLVERLGCPTCFSGADCRFVAERQFIVDPEGVGATPVQDPDPSPWRAFTSELGTNSTVTVALASGIQYDIEKVFRAVDKVIGGLGPCPCHSGFDIQYLNEVSVLGINNELQLQKYGA